MDYKKGQKRKFSLSILTRFILEVISTSGPTPGTAAPKIWQQIQLQHVPGWLFSTVELMWGCINMLSWVSVESNYPELQWCFILSLWQFSHECHWVSGANPGGQTRLAQRCQAMPRWASYTTLCLERSHFVGQEVMKSVFEECSRRAE